MSVISWSCGRTDRVCRSATCAKTRAILDLEIRDRRLKNDLHGFLDGMEKPTHISPTQDVLCSLLREPRYRKGIFAVPDLRHS